ncbi:MAG: TfoX/Sxy family protein [Euryarchaeota archaeon]|nr:TfoX/Sxy family protein [Euryarchaeota archaeon]
MKFPKPNEKLAALLDEAMRDVGGDRRKMFGQLAYFVKGNMLAGVFGDKVFLRLSGDDLLRIRTEHRGVENFEPVAGRTMKEYVVLPESLYGDPGEFGK